MIIVEAPKWAVEKVNKGCRAFFWAGSEETHGGKCVVAWDRVCKLKNFGGLGVVDLHKHGIALILRWEWLKRTDPSRPWQGLCNMVDKQAQEAFTSLVSWQIGDGSQTLFWKDRWLHGYTVKEIAPLLARKVRTQVANRRLVREGLFMHEWINDIRGELDTESLAQFIRLWEALLEVQLAQEVEDRPIWAWNTSGTYTAASAYKMMCEGGIRF